MEIADGVQIRTAADGPDDDAHSITSIASLDDLGSLTPSHRLESIESAVDDLELDPTDADLPRHGMPANMITMSAPIQPL